ncbi:hypothetical protein ES703_123957 [subsurface metagenome]
MGIDLEADGDKGRAQEIVQQVKALEYEGYQFDGAEASFELLLRRHTGEFTPYFRVVESRALYLMLLWPERSETSTWRLPPTVSGSMCSYMAASFMTALT